MSGRAAAVLGLVLVAGGAAAAGVACRRDEGPVERRAFIAERLYKRQMALLRGDRRRRAAVSILGLDISPEREQAQRDRLVARVGRVMKGR